MQARPIGDDRRPERGNRMGADQLSVFIIGGGNPKHLERCIEHASEIGREVVYLNSGFNDRGIARARRLGARLVALDSFTSSALHTDWGLFIRPEERPVLSSAKELQETMMSNKAPGYGVYVTTANTRHLLEQYQWIRKLDQFKAVGNSACVHTIEPRLVRRRLAENCLKGLTNAHTGTLSWICGAIAPGIVITSIPDEVSTDEECPRDHDIRCLKGELVYDITPDDEMVELSEAYTGFRIVHKGHLDGFLRGAQCGFGDIKMYIPMLEFLCKEGCFDEAKDLFEAWIGHRPYDKEQYNTQLMGGLIYSNLLELDNAIFWFKKIADHRESPLAFANLGKLYLIKGEKDKAAEYLEKSKEVENDIFLRDRILSVIDRDDWRSLRMSLCMIARDEEAQIGKALQSVRDTIDEIIVVDTGSSDRTRGIVDGFGGRVIESPWEEDFSRAKNRAIAEATGDYLLFMDADEFIDTRDKFAFALFKRLLPIEKDSAFSIRVEPAKESKSLSVSYLDRLFHREEGEYQIRLIPKRQGIQFQGRVFEDVYKGLRATHTKAEKNDLFRITHSMQGREWRERRKMPAALKSFDFLCGSQKAIEGGLLFLRAGDFDKAYAWLIRVRDMDPQLSIKIAELYSKHDKLEMAKEILTKALKQPADSGDLVLSLAEVYLKQGHYGEIVNLLGTRIEDIKKDLGFEGSAAAFYYLGIASIETGDLALGIEQLALAHEKDPAYMRYKVAGLYAFARAEQWEEALQVAAEIAEEEEIEVQSEVNDFVDVGQIFISLNRHFAQAGKIDEADLCQKIVEAVIKTKLSGDEDIQRMSAVIEAAGSHG